MNLAWRITFFFLIISEMYKNTILNNLNYTDTISDSKYCIVNNISVPLMSLQKIVRLLASFTLVQSTVILDFTFPEVVWINIP